MYDVQLIDGTVFQVPTLISLKQKFDQGEIPLSTLVRRNLSQEFRPVREIIYGEVSIKDYFSNKPKSLPFWPVLFSAIATGGLSLIPVSWSQAVWAWRVDRNHAAGMCTLMAILVPALYLTVVVLQVRDSAGLSQGIRALFSELLLALALGIVFSHAASLFIRTMMRRKCPEFPCSFAKTMAFGPLYLTGRLDELTIELGWQQS